MSEVPTVSELSESVPVPQLLFELPSRSNVFFGNLRDLMIPRRRPPLELSSAPAPFWADVFVKRDVPWLSLLESCAYHAIVFALFISLNRFLIHHPTAVLSRTFDHSQVIYYDASEYLPPIDTRKEPAAEPTKADPEYAPQPIISVPPEADNRSQTIVTPPKVKLRREVAMPNIVAWSENMEQPRLAIPPVPITPASERTRMAPQMESQVVAPPPDANRISRRSAEPNLQPDVVAPPPDLRTSRRAAGFDAPQPAVVAPPPSVTNVPTRLGELNIGRTEVIAPAPQLAVTAQRAIPGGRSSAGAGMVPQVVPPPPSVAGSAGSAQSFGSAGRVIALNLHPDVGAPPVAPPGNRRGTFAATPEGHAGASGSPGSASGTAANVAGHGSSSGSSGTGSNGKSKSDLPGGLYVGSPVRGKTAPVAGDPSASKTAIASSSPSPAPPRTTSPPGRAASPDSAAKLSEAERAVFGNRKFYSLTLNMPNLNSAGGSWVIRFTELKQESDAAADLSQPVATKKVDPGYPLQLMRENVRGTVILYAVIHADGSVGNVRVLSGVDERLDKFASDAVAQWKFEPATKNGAPIEVEATFKIPFRPPLVGTNF
jgi:periplasmic protein TonB